MPQQATSLLLVKCYCAGSWMVGSDGCISTWTLDWGQLVVPWTDQVHTYAVRALQWGCNFHSIVARLGGFSWLESTARCSWVPLLSFAIAGAVFLHWNLGAKVGSRWSETISWNVGWKWCEGWKICANFDVHLFASCWDYTLQDFINYWHDVDGHQRTLIGIPQGTCIYLDRLQIEPSPFKDTTAVRIPAYVRMPCHGEGQIEWIPFDVVAVTYHTGASFTSGHWQTSIRQGAQYHRWLHYDDGSLPQVGLHLTEHIQQNWALVWIAYNPQYHWRVQHLCMWQAILI